MFLTSPFFHRIAVLTFCTTAVLVGCSKKQGTAPDSTTDAAAAQSAAIANLPPAAQAEAAANQAAAAKMVNEANAALKARDYEKAVEAALAAQQQKFLTDQQSAAIRNQMIQLQQDLTTAIANGDAKAKAAAERLRRSASGG
jgi:hypothetical protein